MSKMAPSRGSCWLWAQLNGPNWVAKCHLSLQFETPTAWWLPSPMLCPEEVYPRSACSGVPGGSCKASYDPMSEVPEHVFHIPLFHWIIQATFPEATGGELDVDLLIRDRKSHYRSTCGMQTIILASLGNEICHCGGVGENPLKFVTSFSCLCLSLKKILSIKKLLKGICDQNK